MEARAWRTAFHCAVCLGRLRLVALVDCRAEEPERSVACPEAGEHQRREALILLSMALGDGYRKIHLCSGRVAPRDSIILVP